MTVLCLIPPTPAFKEGSLYECEPIPGGMVVYDNEGFAFVCYAREFQKQFQVLGRKQIIQSIRRLTIWMRKSCASCPAIIQESQFLC